jgi:Flp pilus assembly protein TadD
LARAGQLLDGLRAAGINRKLPQFYDLAYEYLRARNEIPSLERLLNEAISLFPATTRFPLLLAELCVNRGLEDKAEKMANLVLAKDPLASAAHLMLGNIYRKRGLAAKAIDHFQRAADLEPRNQELAVDLAGLLAENGKPDQALVVLRTLLKAGFGKDGAGEDKIRGQAAKMLVKLGQPQLAEELLRELLREQGGNPSHWTQLGLAQLDRGQGDQARQSFRQALQLDPKQALALSGLGTLHLTLFRQNKNRENLDLAYEFFGRARQDDPQLVTAVNGLGVIHLYRGEVRQAIEKLQEAIRLEPTFVNAYFNLAIAQLSIGQRVEARKTLNTLEQKFAGRLNAAERAQLTSLLREAGA